MIVKADELAAMAEFKGIDKDILRRKLEAAENLIRKYTNNNFQNRFARFNGSSAENLVYGGSPFLREGDTVQITQSGVNDGLYTIISLLDDAVQLDKELFTVPFNLVTKVEYPVDVREGVINLLIWEIQNRDKVGVKSETLSRHSVTYYDQDANNSVMGYPVSLLGFLRPYMKGRF